MLFIWYYKGFKIVDTKMEIDEVSQAAIVAPKDSASSGAGHESEGAPPNVAGSDEATT